ncbi:MAG: DUF2807 domain-containing protein [Gloeobacteraceae cyanobacterium ES-bin-316]|nr:DUF2807 domain-containing protein [Ferruginibacter sp.]
MKKILILGFSLFIQLALAAQDNVVLDGNVEARTLKGEFDKIRVSGNIKLVLNQADNISLAVSASEEKYTQNIKTVVSDKTLNISWQGDWNWVKNRELTVYLSFKNISMIAGSGAARISVVGALNLDALQIDLSGASSIKASGIMVQSLTMALSGASEAKLDGTAVFMNVDCSGASDVDADKLITETCNASASGASDLEINVSKELSAVASGASHIYYAGEAEKVNVKNSGVSKILRRQ